MRNDGTGKAILVTGASSGIGALSVRALALAGHTVYAGIRQMATRNATAVADLARYGTDHQVDVQAVELNVTSEDSADAAVDRILAERGRLDVVVHNAGHMVLGAAEAFTAEQLAELYDVNVLGTQRVNRAALPTLREQRRRPRRRRPCGNLRSASPPPDGRSGQAPGRAHPFGRRCDRRR